MWHQSKEMAQDQRPSKKSTRNGIAKTEETTSNGADSYRMSLLSMLVFQAFLTLGKKTPDSEAQTRLFNEGWYSALKDVPTDALKDAFSDALGSGKPFSPGLVVQSYREKIGVEREELKRSQSSPDERPFPYHAKLRQIGTNRKYSFALTEPAVCVDCGRPAEVFKCGSHRQKIFFCEFHGDGLSYPQVDSRIDEDASLFT